VASLALALVWQLMFAWLLERQSKRLKRLRAEIARRHMAA
jgi:hypothetical protein